MSRSHLPLLGSTGNDANPTFKLAQLGVVNVAPLCPQRAQRAERRNTSLDTSAPRMISGASAIGR